MRHFAIALFILMAATLQLGCSAPRPPLVVTDPDPSVKIPAIQLAVQNKDLAAARQLVKDLDSDDPAVRFYAVGGLRRLTGEDFGYIFYQHAEDRESAAQKWREWLRQSEVAAGP